MGLYRFANRRVRNCIEAIWGPGSCSSVFPIICCLMFVLLLLFCNTTKDWSESDYPKLQYPESSIRLLYVQPGTGKDSVHAVIKSYSLAQRPEFEALSYTWGDKTDWRFVRVNGRKMKISGNLYEALTALRRPWEARALWVDQICINQGDIREKNNQIPLMTWIYGRAKNTLIWLGKYDVRGGRTKPRT